MATSGWQNEQTWFTYSSNVRLIGNIRIDTLIHSGSNLRIAGVIACGARGNSGYYFYYGDYTSYAQPEGGDKIALGSKGQQWKVGNSDIYVNFDVTLTNVPAEATSRDFSINFYGPNTAAIQSTLRWTLTFDASGSAPTGGYATYQSCGWDANQGWSYINALAGVSSWGGLSGTFELIAVVGNTNGEADNVTAVDAIARRVWRYSPNNVNVLTYDYTVRQNNTDVGFGNPIAMLGLTHYKLGYWHWNDAGNTHGLDQTLRYLPPTPSKFTYTDPGGEGTKDFSVVFTGDTDNNQPTYDTANLTRTVRYKVNDAADWTYVVQDSQALIGANTSFTVRIPGSQSAVIEGWQTYHGMQSETKTLTLYNGNAPSRVYGSVNGQAKLAYKLYGSVNGQSKEIVKLYGSVNGKSKAILG